MRRRLLLVSLIGITLVLALGLLAWPAIAQQAQFFGRYRGVVTDPIDPLLKGRVQVLVPAVSQDARFAMPSAAFGRTFVTPGLGEEVWVEFEQGDPDFPIWVGGFDAQCHVTHDRRQRCSLVH